MNITTEGGLAPGTEGPSPRMAGEAFLSALQFSDSFFPTGLYTLSHGFEAFVQAGLASKSDVEALLRDYLENVLGPADGVALSHAHRAVEAQDLARLLEIDRRLSALKLVREAREASRRVGKRILTTAIALVPERLLADYRAAVEAGAGPGNAAVALGSAAAALRLVRLDHEEAQVILGRVKPLMLRVAEENMDRSLSEMRAFAPLIDIMAMGHERASVRLFIS